MESETVENGEFHWWPYGNMGWVTHFRMPAEKPLDRWVYDCHHNSWCHQFRVPCVWSTFSLRITNSQRLWHYRAYKFCFRALFLRQLSEIYRNEWDQSNSHNNFHSSHVLRVWISETTTTTTTTAFLVIIQFYDSLNFFPLAPHSRTHCSVNKMNTDSNHRSHPSINYFFYCLFGLHNRY